MTKYRVPLDGEFRLSYNAFETPGTKGVKDCSNPPEDGRFDDVTDGLVEHAEHSLFFGTITIDVRHHRRRFTSSRFFRGGFRFFHRLRYEIVDVVMERDRNFESKSHVIV
uniref:Serine/threonine-protein kinase DCLK2 n=1 Tax=Lygus hesperus TaxID=30085 RepID=A0A0A9VYH3_LYGHE